MPDFEEPLRLHNVLEFWPGPAASTAPSNKARFVFDGTTIKASANGGSAGPDLAGITATAAELSKTDGLTGSIVEAHEVTYTETGGAGTYTGSVSVPAGATILDIVINGVALWDNAGAVTMIVGDGTDPDGYFTAVDLKATDLLAGESIAFETAGGQAGAYIANSQVSPRYSSSARTITGVVTTADTGGSTGRTRMLVVFALPQSSSAAVFAA